MVRHLFIILFSLFPYSALADRLSGEVASVFLSSQAGADQSIGFFEGMSPLSDQDWLNGFDVLRKEYLIVDGKLAAVGDARVEQLLSESIDAVEVGTRVLTNDQKAQLEVALSVLFADVADRTASDEYLAYLEYEERVLETTLALQAANNSDEISFHTSELAKIERDWLLFGYRGEIDSALETLRRYDEESQGDVLEVWSQLLDEGRVTRELLGRVDSGVSSRSWVQIEADIGLGTVTLQFMGDSEATFETELVKSVIEFVVVDITPDFASAQFLRSNSWRYEDGRSISDEDLSSKTDAEVVNAVPSSLILVRRIEFFFESGMPYETFESAIGFSGVQIQDFVVDKKDSNISLSPSRIEFGGPFILGLKLFPFVGIPETADNLNWE